MNRSRDLDFDSQSLARMSKTRFTEADVKRAIRGVLNGGGRIARVEIWPDGRISVLIKDGTSIPIDPEDDPEVSRKLL